MGTKHSGDQQKIDILALNRMKLLDENEEEVLVSSYWKEHSVVLIFIRQFSCIACRAHVDQIIKKKSELEKKRTKVIFIGNGSPYMIKVFKEDLNIKNELILTDPSLKFFDACGLKRNPIRLLDPRGIMKIKDLLDQDYKQGAYNSDSGNYTQLGGVVALNPPGKVVYHFISDFVGDFDEPEDWIKD